MGSFPEGDAPGGIHDLAGNVWEWTSSDYDATGAARVFRGGSWFNFNPVGMRAALRSWLSPTLGRARVPRLRAPAIRRRARCLLAGWCVAWFDEALATERLGPARGSGVLVWGASGWAIAQYNLALTIPNEQFADVRKVLEVH